VGGGFGGLAAATALKHTAVRIIVIDRTNHHVFQLLPYQIAFPIRGIVSTRKIKRPFPPTDRVCPPRAPLPPSRGCPRLGAIRVQSTSCQRN
jgi:2-polyprenyl-6-methoxyphenol hydroxylase-like FAD-dependent oxidoreductase